MKFRHALLNLRGPVLIAAAVALALLVPHAKGRVIQAGNYPAVVCPGAFGASSESISLPSEGLLTRQLGRANQSLHRQKAMVLKGGPTPILVNGNSGSELVFNTLPGASTAAALCQVGGIDQWFIGGSGSVTSQGVLEIINSGLSDSTVQIFPYNSKVALAPLAVIVKANSSQRISLATIAPGDQAVALHLVTESGRVSSFLLDHRKNGLKEQGSSFVTPVDAPLRDSYIAGILGSVGKATSFMRFLVPGNLDAMVHLSIFSNGGKFTPVGFDSISIVHQRVVDLPLPALALATPFGIEISSDQPLFASTFTSSSAVRTNFAWANQLTPLSHFAVNLAGAKAQFLFIGKSIAIRAQWSGSKGGSHVAVISGESTALFRPSGALKRVTFTLLSRGSVYGGAVVTNLDGGLNYLPLLASQLSTNREAPVADLRTLARH